jgi:hypothetical protein
VITNFSSNHMRVLDLLLTLMAGGLVERAGFHGWSRSDRIHASLRRTSPPLAAGKAGRRPKVATPTRTMAHQTSRGEPSARNIVKGRYGPRERTLTTREMLLRASTILSFGDRAKRRLQRRFAHVTGDHYDFINMT